MTAARAAVAAVLLLAGTARAEVYTDLSDVRACLPLGGETLVGTGGGLARVDAAGAVRGVWTAVDGLPGTRVEAVAAVGDEVWVGTDGGAAQVRLADGRLAIVRSIASAPVLDIARLGATRYLATRDGGVLALGPTRPTGTAGATAVPMRGTSKARLHVSSLAVADGALYAGTAAGLFRLERGRFEHVALAGAALDIASLHAEGARLWIATATGLYAREGDALSAYGGGDVRRVTALPDSTIVAATLGGGALRVDRGRLVALAGAPRAQMLQAFAARGPATCAGGLDGLWLRAAPDAPWVAAAPAAGPPANDISALAVDGARLWVGTFDHGLAVLERGTWRRVTDAHLDLRVNALLVDRAHRVWVATAAGLSRIDGDRVTQLAKADGLPARSVLALAELADGRILAGTTSGAAIIGDGRPVLLGVKQNVDVANVWAVAEDADGWLWLGTTTGLYRGRAGDAAWTRYAIATGQLRDDWVMALAPRGHSLWVGTYKGGVTRFDVVARFDAGDTVTATPLGDGWINPGGLRWDGDTLYAATMNGLRAGDGATATWRTVDGLPGRDTTATARLGDARVVATRRGLLVTR